MIHYLVTYKLIKKLTDREFEEQEVKREVITAYNTAHAYDKMRRKYASDKIAIQIQQAELTLISPDMSAGEIQ